MNLGLLNKKITFKRMDQRKVSSYQVYALYPDNTYSSGIREELLDTINNTQSPNCDLTSIEYKYNINYTWKLPYDLYTDQDHKFKIYINGKILSSLYYQFNKYNNLLTIDQNLKVLEETDIIRIDYYRDMISKSYILENDCTIKVIPVFNEDYVFGNHNIIL